MIPKSKNIYMKSGQILMNTSYVHNRFALFHSTRQVAINTTFVSIGVGIVLTGVIGKYILDAIPSRHKSIPINQSAENATNGDLNVKTQAKSGWASDWFAKSFYDGGFEEKMTKREAALILGIRESATTDRIKEAHRRIMLLNHPDRGGSPYLTAKINEAKDLLTKGKS